MKIFKVEADEDLFVVVTDTPESAKEIVVDQYFDGEKVELEVEESKVLPEGIVLHYDNEDIYFN